MSSGEKQLIKSDVIIEVLLQKLFEDNLIDADTYVVVKNMSKEVSEDGTDK